MKEIGRLSKLEFLVVAEDSRSEFGSVLNDDSIRCILKGCPNMKSLALAGTKARTCQFTDESLSLIPRMCPKMEQLRLLKANRITDATIASFGDLKTLRVLHVSSCEKVTSKGLIECIEKTSKTIRNFRLSECKDVNMNLVDAWYEVASHRPMEKIKVFIEGLPKAELKTPPTNLKMEVKFQEDPKAAKGVTNGQPANIQPAQEGPVVVNHL